MVRRHLHLWIHLCDGKLLLPSPKGELAILSLNTVGSELVVEYITPDESDYDLILSNTIGQVYFRTALNVPAYGDKVLYLDQNKLPSGYTSSPLQTTTEQHPGLYFPDN